MPTAKILIIYTGGTIGMGHETPGDAHSPLIPQGWEFLQKSMPTIAPNGYFNQEKGIEFEYISFEKVIDSSDFTHHHWSRVAEMVHENYILYDGFIVIHGTDTMAYTASALSFAFQNLSKPVVLTGSQLPIFHPRTDAIGNLSNAIHIAAAKAFNLPIIPEVLICFNDKLLRGNRSTKSSSRDFSGFESPSFPVLGDLKETIKIYSALITKQPEGEFEIFPNFETNIITTTISPGFNTNILTRLAKEDQLKGVILRTFGSGNAPSHPEFIAAVKELHAHNKVILNISQCQDGFVNMKKYKSGKNLLDCGVLSGADMTLEAAIAKMMWVLANEQIDNTKEMISKNLKGELTQI
jgi:L-asparaginase